MEYEINVAKPNGMNQYVHYFKVVAEYGTYQKVYADLVKAFPDCKIDVYIVQKISKLVEIDTED